MGILNNKLTEIEWDTCWMAIRYAMNRQTIASATLPEMLMKQYYHRWSDNQKDMILRDLKSNFKEYGEDSFGNKNIDQPIWLKFMNCLDKTKHFKVLLIDDTEATLFESNEVYYPLDKYISNPSQNFYCPKENIKKYL